MTSYGIAPTHLRGIGQADYDTIGKRGPMKGMRGFETIPVKALKRIAGSNERVKKQIKRAEEEEEENDDYRRRQNKGRARRGPGGYHLDDEEFDMPMEARDRGRKHGNEHPLDTVNLDDDRFRTNSDYRGFGSMPREKVQEIAAKGGRSRRRGGETSQQGRGKRQSRDDDDENESEDEEDDQDYQDNRKQGQGKRQGNNRRKQSRYDDEDEQDDEDDYGEDSPSRNLNRNRQTYRGNVSPSGNKQRSGAKKR